MRISGSSVLAVAVCLYGTAGCAPGPDDSAYAAARARMVAGQIEARGITDQRVLTALRKVERHLF